MNRMRKPGGPMTPRPKGRAAVYRLFDADGELLYVGCSNNPKGRCTTHSRQKPWWHEVAERTFIWYEERAEADAAERKAIETENPKYNVVHTPLHSKICDSKHVLTAEESAAWVRTWDPNYVVPPGSRSSARSKAHAVARTFGRGESDPYASA